MAERNPAAGISFSEGSKDMTVLRLLEILNPSLEIRLLAGESGLTRPIVSWELNRPGLAFAGFFQQFYNDRVQIMGGNDVAYLESLPLEQRVTSVRKVLEFKPPCLILTTAFRPPEGLIEECDATQTPLLITPIRTSLFASKLTGALLTEFAPSVTAHGTLVNVFGLGVLMSGKSGVGKSECSLDLISRGHRLVADDIVSIKRIAPNTLLGRGSQVIRHHMEIHGIGIVDIMSLFGVASVLEESEIDLHIQLETWREDATYERVGLEDRFTRILGVLVPEYVIPVEPGRNLSIIVEAAVLNQKMRGFGVNIAAQFNERLIRRMSQAVPPEALLSPAGGAEPGEADKEKGKGKGGRKARGGERRAGCGGVSGE